MRYAAILALSLSLAFAQEATDTPVSAGATVPAAEPEGAKPYIDLMQAHTEFMQKLAGCLENVTDTESAKEAAPKVAALQGQAYTLLLQEKSALALGEPAADVSAYVEKKFNTKEFEALIKNSIGRGLDLLSSVPACYGATTLETALTNLFELYLGGVTGEEEEDD